MVRKFFIVQALVIGLTIIIFFSCSKDAVQKNIQATEYFPNSIGDYWEYDVFDSSQIQQQSTNSRNYTVKVSIVGTKKLLDNLDATIWQYQYPWGNDTNYIRIVGDTVKVFDIIYSSYLEDLNFPRQIFLLPFEDDKRWNGKLLYVDTFHVTLKTNVITDFNNYDSCFKIYRHYLGPNLEFTDDYWFKPNIGMIKIYCNEYNLGPNNVQLWQLKRYSLK